MAETKKSSFSEHLACYLSVTGILYLYHCKCLKQTKFFAHLPHVSFPPMLLEMKQLCWQSHLWPTR